MANIALKVDVDTFRGTLQGVPRLLDIFARLGVSATFLFSLGPDHTGWALRRVFRPGFLSKVSRTSVVKHYGLRTLAYGVLLPAPDIGRRAADPMRACHYAGHECGIHTWDHVVWQDNVRSRGGSWTQQQMQQAYQRFGDIFGMPPATHGAAGWQTNDDAMRQIDAWGMAYASDGRGSGPYRPVARGEPLHHVQMPTTLPTFDERLGEGGLDAGAVVQSLLRLTDNDRDQVFTLHAELEGRLLAPEFEVLLQGWRSQGHQLVPLGALYRTLQTAQLPARPLIWGSVPGRSGQLVVA